MWFGMSQISVQRFPKERRGSLPSRKTDPDEIARPSLRALIREDGLGRMRERHLRMVETRIEECKDRTDSNCIGTAFYIAGESARHGYVKPSEAASRISGLRRLPVAIDGCLVAWERRLDPALYPDVIRKIGINLYIAHAGVVSSTAPLLVANRIHNNGIFVGGQPLEDINRAYPHCNASFYLPTALANREFEGWLGLF